MNIHEYQAKAILKKYGVNVSEGRVIKSLDEVEGAAQELIKNGADLLVVKAQIHAGGRGKGSFKEDTNGTLGGGVQLAKSAEEAKQKAANMLGNTLVTHQTGPEGRQVKTIYIEHGSDIEKELYLSLLVDRETSRVTFVVSQAGGVDIEDVAANSPEQIITVEVDPASGLVDSMRASLHLD